MKASKIEIRQVDGEKGIFTEILVDGHKLALVKTVYAETVFYSVQNVMVTKKDAR